MTYTFQVTAFEPTFSHTASGKGPRTSIGNAVQWTTGANKLWMSLNGKCFAKALNLWEKGLALFCGGKAIAKQLRQFSPNKIIFLNSGQTSTKSERKLRIDGESYSPDMLCFWSIVQGKKHVLNINQRRGWWRSTLAFKLFALAASRFVYHHIIITEPGINIICIRVNI